jgi:hypothetical protein
LASRSSKLQLESTGYYLDGSIGTYWFDTIAYRSDGEFLPNQ